MNVASHTEVSVTPLVLVGAMATCCPESALADVVELLFGRGTRLRQNGNRHHGQHTQLRTHHFSLRDQGATPQA